MHHHTLAIWSFFFFFSLNILNICQQTQHTLFFWVSLKVRREYVCPSSLNKMESQSKRACPRKSSKLFRLKQRQNFGKLINIQVQTLQHQPKRLSERKKKEVKLAFPQVLKTTVCWIVPKLKTQTMLLNHNKLKSNRNNGRKNHQNHQHCYKNSLIFVQEKTVFTVFY